MVVWLSEKAAARLRPGAIPRQSEAGSEGDASSPAQADMVRTTRGGLDYRLLLLGTMLPDMIDKPLGTWLMADVFSNGRIFAHTLLFALVWLVVAIYQLAHSKRTGMLSLALGVIAHLGLDQMWLQAGTLLWPLSGWGFPKGDTTHWLSKLFRFLLTRPKVYIPEVIGAVCLAVFFGDIIRRRKLGNFLKTGRV